MRFPKLTRGRMALSVAALPVLAFGWLIADVFIINDNFRVSSPTLYRSGQLRAEEWDETLQGAKYRTVVNLRGAKPGKGWYDEEIRFASTNGLAHVDFALSADKAPTVDQMNQIVDVLRQAPKPILIHCKNGSDRSGLVAALYLNAVEGVKPETAAGQLSLWYGHFPWLTSRTGAMEAALGQYFTAHAHDRPRTTVAEQL